MLLPRTSCSTGGDSTMARLLDGIRVIDAANFIAGPVSTTIMADFGADVIKVEPPTGDVYRVRGAGYVPSPYNYPWIVDNRTKRSVAIDLRTADGQELLHRLVRDVDVFVTNAPLDSRARLRQHRAVGAHGADGPRARLAGRAARALAARHGRSPDGHVDVRGHHGRSLPSGAHRARHPGGDVAAGQWTLDER